MLSCLGLDSDSSDLRKLAYETESHKLSPLLIDALYAAFESVNQSLVLSHLRYAVPVWSHDLQSRLEKMFNRAVRVVYGLRKFDHVSALQRKLEWLSVQSLIQHHCLLMLYRYYRKYRKYNTVESTNSIWQTIAL